MEILKKETIYEKRYPKACCSGLDAPDGPRVQAAYEAFCAGLAERAGRPDDPDKLALADGAVRTAMELSEAYRIDTQIQRGQGCVNITLSFDYCAFSGELMELFSKLLFMADDCGFFHIPDTGRDITLSVGYRTR